MTLNAPPTEESPPQETSPVSQVPPVAVPRRYRKRFRWQLHLVLYPLLTFAFGILIGYLVWGEPSNRPQPDLASLTEQVNPKEGFTLPVKYGKVGPELTTSGVIDYEKFLQVYSQAGSPLTQEQMDILNQGSTANVVINQQNSYFLLNYFWAVGLANKNPILDSGPIMQQSGGQIDRFASTGGWTIGKKAVKDLFSSVAILPLNAEQQGRLEEAAKAVYRPCCDNPTHFPDCNHGMAMLGLFELMASQNASVDQMLEAAKNVNAFWFPSQTVEQALYFKNTAGQNYKDVSAKTITGSRYSSGSGYKQVNQWLTEKGLLGNGLNSGGSCGV